MFHNPFSDGIVVLIILLLFFGPKRLPQLSRSIGESIKEFKGGVGDGSSSDEESSKLPSAERPVPAEASESAVGRAPVEAGTERSS